MIETLEQWLYRVGLKLDPYISVHGRTNTERIEMAVDEYIKMQQKHPITIEALKQESGWHAEPFVLNGDELGIAFRSYGNDRTLEITVYSNFVTVQTFTGYGTIEQSDPLECYKCKTMEQLRILCDLLGVEK